MSQEMGGDSTYDTGRHMDEAEGDKRNANGNGDA